MITAKSDVHLPEHELVAVELQHHDQRERRPAATRVPPLGQQRRGSMRDERDEQHDRDDEPGALGRARAARAPRALSAMANAGRYLNW